MGMVNYIRQVACGGLGWKHMHVACDITREQCCINNWHIIAVKSVYKESFYKE